MPVIQSTKAASPPGKIAPFAQSAVPAGWLACNGASVAAAKYPALFAAIGYTYGGAGASFSLPDLRGEFLRGADDGRGIDPGRSIASAQAHQSNALAEVQNALIGGPPDAATIPTDGSWSGWVQSGDEGVSPNWSHRFRLAGVETRPRNVAVMYCIKT